MPRACVGRRASATICFRRGPTNCVAIILIRFRIVRRLLWFKGERICRFKGVLSTCTCVTNFQFRANAITFQTGYFSTVPNGRRAVLCLVLVFFGRLRRIVGAIRVLISFPGRPTLFIHRFVVEDRGQRIRFLHVISRLFFPFSRFFATPACSHSFVGEWEAIKGRRVLVCASGFTRTLANKTNASQKIR